MEGVEIRIGSVIAGGGELQFSVVLEKDGKVWVTIYASGYGSRAGGVLLRMQPESLDGLEAKISEAKDVARKLRLLVK